MVVSDRFELSTFPLSAEYSTTELWDEWRTRRESNPQVFNHRRFSKPLQYHYGTRPYKNVNINMLNNNEL